jgi:MinD-like ATPase involved in chromosome partitioning or flagellar assembly
MYTVCWSAKGGSGTTVVAAALALLAARRGPTMLIDLGGDSAAALGTVPADGPGVGDWLSTPAAPADRLWQLAHACGTDLQLVHPGTMPTGAELTELAIERLAAAAAGSGADVIIDAGSTRPTEAMVRCAGRSLLVIRPCYLALRRAAAFGIQASRLIVIAEPGRCLNRTDIERALGVPVAAELPWDPAVARAVDAGLLQARLPSSIARPLGRLQLSDDAPALHP